MNLKTIFDNVAEFQNATEQPVNSFPTLSNSQTEDFLRFNLMKEENREYIVASANKDLVEVLDSLVDQLYVLAGTINQHGMQDVIEEAFNRVHANNLTKVGVDGKVIRDADGKILKPEGFVPVDLSDLVNLKFDKL